VNSSIVRWSERQDPTSYAVRVRPLVLAHGCFDLLHLGHIRHLEESAKLGDYLLVSVTSDRFVTKGAGRPRFTAEERAEALRALSCVDEVVINDNPTAVPVIENARPDVYVKGSEYDGRETDEALQAEIDAAEKAGARIVYTTGRKWSSSRILNAQRHSKAVTDYLDDVREKGALARIERAFAEIRKMKVAFVGETITDEYVYVVPLAKPSKEFVLCGAQQSGERFKGGIRAAAAHLDGICATGIVTQPIRYPLMKRRYVEAGLTRKLFEVYAPSWIDMADEWRALFLRTLKDHVEDSDVVVTIDFGHGLIDAEARSTISQARFLALNAQTNAGNQGFNPVTKYDHADYVCVDLPEARLAMHDERASPADAIDFLSSTMGAEHVVVTHGREGAYWRGGAVPAFASQPIDTMGAGDCFLAITAPLVAAGLEIETAAFVGSVAAGMKTEIVGHRQAVDGGVLLQTVRSLLA